MVIGIIYNIYSISCTGMYLIYNSVTHNRALLLYKRVFYLLYIYMYSKRSDPTGTQSHHQDQGFCPNDLRV